MSAFLINTLLFALSFFLGTLFQRFVLSCKKKITVDELYEVITEWKFAWMNIKGTDEKDRSNYFHRASRIDANMKYGLAKMLLEFIESRKL